MHLWDYKTLAIALTDETIRALFIAIPPTVAAVLAHLSALKGNRQNDELKQQGKVIQQQTDGQLSALQLKLDEEYKKNEELRKLITALVDKDIQVRQAKAVVAAQGEHPLGELIKTEDPFPPAGPQPGLPNSPLSDNQDRPSI